jgi:nitrogen-specific signal transduction histidine kinase
MNNKVEIRVTDNGNGIPQKVMDKIFQPFFTTKPTGQGTGLGLSLSYDIVKAHGGEIKWKVKKVKEQHLLFNCLLSESRIMTRPKIGLHVIVNNPAINVHFVVSTKIALHLV